MGFRVVWTSRHQACWSTPARCCPSASGTTGGERGVRPHPARPRPRGAGRRRARRPDGLGRPPGRPRGRALARSRRATSGITSTSGRPATSRSSCSCSSPRSRRRWPPCSPRKPAALQLGGDARWMALQLGFPRAARCPRAPATATCPVPAVVATPRITARPHRPAPRAAPEGDAPAGAELLGHPAHDRARPRACCRGTAWPAAPGPGPASPGAALVWTMAVDAPGTRSTTAPAPRRSTSATPTLGAKAMAASAAP